MLHHIGCNKNTKKCEFYIDYPGNGVKSELRPRCCTAWLLELLNYTSHLFESSSIIYWLEFGTLLGAYRDHKFISWDGDIDFGTLSSSEILALAPKIKKDGYVLSCRVLGKNINEWVDADSSPIGEIEIFRIKYSKINNLHVDVFPVKIENQIAIKLNSKVGKKKQYCPSEHYQNLDHILLYDKVYPMPSNSSNYLALMYGQDYNIPKREVPKWE